MFKMLKLFGRDVQPQTEKISRVDFSEVPEAVQLALHRRMSRLQKMDNSKVTEISSKVERGEQKSREGKVEKIFYRCRCSTKDGRTLKYILVAVTDVENNLLNEYELVDP